VKLFLTALALLSFVGVATAQDPPPTLAREHLLGPVRSLETGRVDYANGKPVEGKRQIGQKLSFDERGNRIEGTTYQDGRVAERLVYTYDVLGRNTGYDEYYSLSNQPLRGPRKHIYTLNANGKIVEYMVYDTGGAVADRFTYQYDPKGHKLEEDFYSWTGKLSSRLVYTYDEAGHNLTQTSYNSDDVVSWKSVNTYDAEGRQLEWAQYIDGLLRYKGFFKYDREGRIAEQETLEFNAPPSSTRASHAPVPGKVVYSYNERERSTETSTYDPDGSLKSKEVRMMDEKGNETGVAQFDEKGSPKNNEIRWYDKNKLVRTLSGKSVSTFEYDSHGNWTKKTYSILPAGAKEAEPYSAEYRTITYYEN
jgi:hypothetical protein